MKVVVALNYNQFMFHCHDLGLNPRRVIYISTNSLDTVTKIYGRIIKEDNIITVGTWYEGRYTFEVMRELEHRCDRYRISQTPTC